MGVALVGADGIHWAELDKGINNGVVSVFLAWIIAPGLAGAFASIIFLITKYGVMLRSNPVLKGLCAIPVYFGITASLLTMLIVWKGGKISLSSFSDAEMIGLIIGVGAAWGVVIAIFLVPWLYRLVVKDDWSLRFWHIPLGPLLLRRPEPQAQPEGAEGGIKDFYEGHLNKEELAELRRAGRPGSDEFERQTDSNEGKKVPSGSDAPDVAEPIEHKPRRKIVGPKPEGLPIYSPTMLFWYMKFLLFNGVDQDIVKLQAKEGILSGDLEEIHANVPHYDNRAEYLFTFLQVMTACTASFTHGANDVANAIGPYATIYEIWNSGAIKKKADVPTWIL